MKDTEVMKQIGLVPELKCANIEKSLDFYIQILDFSILYQREREHFAYLKKDNAEIMLEQIGASRDWLTGKLTYPFGRGINFQIEIGAVGDLYRRVNDNQWPIFLSLEEKWYRKDDYEVGNKQFIVQDPDGYLLRFYQDIGERK